MVSNLPIAIRLVFSYSGNRIALRDSQRLSLYVPPTEVIEGEQPFVGYRIEVRSVDEQPLYRKEIPHLIPTDREIFPARPGEPFVRQSVERPEGIFWIDIPDIPNASSLVFQNSSPTSKVFRSSDVSEIARFDLTRGLP